ncbi:MAG TPA: hypothetical protein VGF94_30250 [Kofleriaceae bacterium]
MQTEDSGVLSPHLFTHLFHGGVIVSTRKLVYDAGANEEAIKALMQAQHKAVMKELRKGAFDEKIDQYLGGTEGLEPVPERPTRASTDVDDKLEPDAPAPQVVVAAPEPVPEPPPVVAERPEPSAPSIEIIPPSESSPVLLTARARTKTEDRTSTSKLARANPPSEPPPVLEEDEAPTLSGPDAREVAAAVRRAATPPPVPATARLARLATPPPVPYKHLPQDFRIDSSPEIEISIEDDSSGRTRAPRDTAVETPGDVTVPTVVPDNMPVAARRGDSAAPGTRRTQTGDRPPSLVGATLPPAPRPPSRPAFTPPQVMSRPIAATEGRGRDSDAVEVYAPAPPSADAPPGDRARGGGQYSLGRGKPSDSVPLKESTGRIPAVRSASNSSPPQPPPPQRSQQGSSPPPIRPAQPTPSAGVPQARPPAVTAPMAARTPPSGVVMTRPAMIVGAPPKAAAAPPRVRKAREDEGRGFGQGLISEKSLDEVILAYLSEDAEEK